MFGFSLAAQLFQGSAQRTWNCVTQFTNLLWYKFNYIRHPIMPRSRRRHHSRSRSRSRSHSHDRDRDVKRRKIDNVDSPPHKRSVSCEPDLTTLTEDTTNEGCKSDTAVLEQSDKSQDTTQDLSSSANESVEIIGVSNNDKMEDKLKITPQKTMSPKQIQKKLESEKKKKQKQMEREERERKRQEEKEEKERIRVEKLKQKQEEKEQKQKDREMKEEQRRKEKEQKQKEKEEKEAKRKEKEEREEQKRKEREQERLRKQQEIDEKNKEKIKIEEKKQKAAAAFVSFFVPKKTGVTEEKVIEENKCSLFMPFQVKSDMRLPPLRRPNLSEAEKNYLSYCILNPIEGASYIEDLKNGKPKSSCPKTWPGENAADEVLIVEEDFGESICEDKSNVQRLRAKFLKFHENRRPPYFGTWRKKSKHVKPRRPFSEDKVFFDYEVDSDDDWEEEEQGESLNGSDDEADKENDVENDDYEVDNEFFVPHGHLSDDEIDDEATARLSPESLKQKLKLLKDEFDQDMQTKTSKIKPRAIGCIWYNHDYSNVDKSIDGYLKPLAMLTNGQVFVKERRDYDGSLNTKRNFKVLREDLILPFLKMIHGNVKKRKEIVNNFFTYMENNDILADISRAQLSKCLKSYAQWKKCPEEGALFNKFCWCVNDDIRNKYNLRISACKK